MTDTFLQILPLAIAGAVSPLGIVAIIATLSQKDQPIKKSLLFLLGSTLILAVVGIVLGYGLIRLSAGGGQSPFSAWLDLILGVLIIIIQFKPSKSNLTQINISKNAFLVAGAGFMTINASTLIVYLALCKILANSNIGSLQKASLLAISIAIVMSLMALPVILVVGIPSRSKQILSSLTKFVSKYGTIATKVVFGAIGIYLIVRSIPELMKLN